MRSKTSSAVGRNQTLGDDSKADIAVSIAGAYGRPRIQLAYGADLVCKRRVRSVGLALLALGVLLIAGPEFFLSIELIAILNSIGVELFLLSFGGLQLLWFWNAIKGVIERFDPYFFIPSRSQIKQIPGVVAHAVPLLVLVTVSGVFGALAEIAES